MTASKADAVDETPPGAIPVDWRADGLLWAVNRHLLHPRGYALAVDVDDTGTPTGTMWLLGDGSEVWHYAANDGTLPDPDEDRLKAAFEALLRRATVHNRAHPPKPQPARRTPRNRLRRRRTQG